MAKQDIHPEKQIVTVVMNDGTEYQLKMSLPNQQTRLVLDIDPTTHNAWSDGGERKLIDTSGRVSKFNNKFSFLN